MSSTVVAPAREVGEHPFAHRLRLDEHLATLELGVVDDDRRALTGFVDVAARREVGIFPGARRVGLRLRPDVFSRQGRAGPNLFGPRARRAKQTGRLLSEAADESGVVDLIGSSRLLLRVGELHFEPGDLSSQGFDLGRERREVGADFGGIEAAKRR